MLSNAEIAKVLGIPERRLNYLLFSGAERGYNEEEDLITETKDGVPLAQMWREFQRILRQWNAERQPLVNLLTFPVSDPIEGVRYPLEEDFEEASEFGLPKSIRLGPAKKMGYDFKWYDIGIRYTWRFLLDSTADQLRALQNTAMDADNRLVFTKILRAVFNNVTRVANIDEENINVYPFYNGDTDIPPRWRTNVHATAHQHYLTSGAAAVVSEDLDDMQVHLAHHGYNMLGGYQLVLLVNESEGTVIRGFTRADGDKYDFIPSANVGGGLVIAPNSGIIGAPALANIPGMVSIGTYGQFTIVEDAYIPAGYMLGMASGGDQNIGNPVGFRQHENPAVQGMKLVKGVIPDYPLMDSYYTRGFGTGVRHRGAGVVMEITADATYDVPEEYVA